MYIYCKYTETKLISLFNVITIDFNILVAAFQDSFLILSEKGLSVTCLTNFAPRQWLIHRTKVSFLLEVLSLNKHMKIWLLTVSFFGVKWTKNTPSIFQTSASIILPADGRFFNYLAMDDFGPFQTLPWALSPVRNDVNNFHNCDDNSL
jgi:hypothetical protein